MNDTGAPQPRLSLPERTYGLWCHRKRAGGHASAALIAACATALLLPIASSFAFHLANLRLSDEGTSAFMIGVSAGIQALGVTIAAPFTPVAARVIGGRAAILLGVLCAVGASLMLMSEERAFGSQAAGRALLAIGIAFIYTTGESLIVRCPRLRSNVDGVGIYSTLLAAGAALGPLCVAAVGTRGDFPGVLGTCCSLRPPHRC
jgi:MFS family permease